MTDALKTERVCITENVNKALNKSVAAPADNNDFCYVNDIKVTGTHLQSCYL